MNPTAIEYYRKWLRARDNAIPFYMALLALTVLSFIALAVYFRVRTGDWNTNRTLLISSTITIPASLLMIGAARAGSSIGAWTLLEGLEAGYRGGDFRAVWHALMIKYRGLIPNIVAHERFHRLFVAVGADIVKNEHLTEEQARWMEELLSVAKENLAVGRVDISASKASYAKPLLLAAAITTALSAIIHLL